MAQLFLSPISFREACAFVKDHHRHNKPPRGMKFCVGVRNSSGVLVGVGIAGRPIARALQDGLTLEVNRTCTTGASNANSMIYGALRRAAWALGYRRLITYTQANESGVSLRAAGFVQTRQLAARKSWAESSVQLRGLRDEEGSGGVARIRWEISRDGQ